ncbi:hypothetical protein [Methanocella sp. MCL-LM]|uniref:hypothetical protein n=1 Tax=Methanocella sp. MCL-LM TaxID=3412035 RepID=UPI003C77771A
MSSIDILVERGRVSRILEPDRERYLNFYSTSYQDNLEHSAFIIEHFPRWSIISGYYAMHDATKLLIAKGYGYKIDEDVHSTAIAFLSEILKDDELIDMFQSGYREYQEMAGRLHGAREERRKAQYYTGTLFAQDYFKKRSKKFHDETVVPYIEKILVLMEAV